jgi:hypothetical protein
VVKDSLKKQIVEVFSASGRRVESRSLIRGASIEAQRIKALFFDLGLDRVDSKHLLAYDELYDLSALPAFLSREGLFAFLPKLLLIFVDDSDGVFIALAESLLLKIVKNDDVFSVRGLSLEQRKVLVEVFRFLQKQYSGDDRFVILAGRALAVLREVP